MITCLWEFVYGFIWDGIVGELVILGLGGFVQSVDIIAWFGVTVGIQQRNAAGIRHILSNQSFLQNQHSPRIPIKIPIFKAIGGIRSS